MMNVILSMIACNIFYFAPRSKTVDSPFLIYFAVFVRFFLFFRIIQWYLKIRIKNAFSFAIHMYV